MNVFRGSQALWDEIKLFSMEGSSWSHRISDLSWYHSFQCVLCSSPLSTENWTWSLSFHQLADLFFFLSGKFLIRIQMQSSITSTMMPSPDGFPLLRWPLHLPYVLRLWDDLPLNALMAELFIPRTFVHWGYPIGEGQMVKS